MPVRLAAATAVLLFTSFASSALAQSAGKETLAHLEGISVVVENMDEDAERDGLRKSDISVDTKLALRRAGINVYTEEERFATVSKPYLYIYVNTFRDQGLYAYTINVEVTQVVYHYGNAPANAITYYVTPVIGTVGVRNLRGVRDNVQDRVNIFINDWLEVHEE